LALVLGAADGVLTCLDLGLYSGTYRLLQGVNVPVEHIAGSVVVGCKVYLFSDESQECFLQVAADASGTVYSMPFFECVGVRAGMATLVSQEIA